MTGWVDSVLKYCRVASSLKSGAPGQSQSTGSIDHLVPDRVRCAAGRRWWSCQLELLLLLSCRCPACAESAAGDVRALPVLSSAGYGSPCWRLLTLSLRADERVSQGPFCSSAVLFHSWQSQRPHGQNGFAYAKSCKCRAEHSASPNLHVPQAVYTFSKWKACNCSPDFCTASVCLSTQHPQSICLAVEVSASLNPSEGVTVGTEIPGHPSP